MSKKPESGAQPGMELRCSMVRRWWPDPSQAFSPKRPLSLGTERGDSCTALADPLCATTAESPASCPLLLAPALCSACNFATAYGNGFYLSSSDRAAAARCAPADGNLGLPAGSFRGCIASSQLFCRECLGPVTSAWRRRDHLCKQVIPVRSPASPPAHPLR